MRERRHFSITDRLTPIPQLLADIVKVAAIDNAQVPLLSEKTLKLLQLLLQEVNRILIAPNTLLCLG